MVKNLPAVPETWVQPLDWEDALEEEMATHSVFLNRGAWHTTVHSVSKSWILLSN